MLTSPLNVQTSIFVTMIVFRNLSFKEYLNPGNAAAPGMS